MAGAALLGRLAWYTATVVERREETKTARTLVLEVPQWPGHDAGQHVDVRLRAADGYTAVRSYSIASAVGDERLELTVEELPDGEVSPYLAQTIAPGDRLEIRGPVGGWFVWKPASLGPVQLVAGGAGVVPLMSMIRTRARTRNGAPFRLLYSSRARDATIYVAELERRAIEDGGLDVTFAYTRAAPPGWPRAAARIDAALIADVAFTAQQDLVCYVCGPTPFVEAMARLLAEAGYDASRIKTERFGPTGGLS